MNDETTVDEFAEIYENIHKLDADEQGDVLDTMRALARDDLDGSTVINDAIRLAKTRRVAAKHGIKIGKRFNGTFGESGFMLIDAMNNTVLSGAEPVAYSLSLDELEVEVQAYAALLDLANGETIVATARTASEAPLIR